MAANPHEAHQADRYRIGRGRPDRAGPQPAESFPPDLKTADPHVQD
jgi:hypothetical protein